MGPIYPDGKVWAKILTMVKDIKKNYCILLNYLLMILEKDGEKDFSKLLYADIRPDMESDKKIKCTGIKKQENEKKMDIIFLDDCMFFSLVDSLANPKKDPK